MWFKEWKDSKKMVYLHTLLTMALVFLFMGIYINIPEESQRANIYQVMLIWAGIIATGDAIFEKNWIFAWAGWGDQKRAIPAFIFGLLACIGNQYFKSGAFSFGAHFCNNLLVFMG